MLFAQKHSEYLKKFQKNQIEIDREFEVNCKKIIDYCSIANQKQTDELEFNSFLSLFHHTLKGSEHVLTDLANDTDIPEITSLVLQVTRSLLGILFQIWQQRESNSTQDLQLYFFPRARSILNIFKLFAIASQTIAKYLSNTPGFFELMMGGMLLHKELFKIGLSILEGVIISNPDIINAENFHLIKTALESMSLKQVARFSRVLSNFFHENTEKLEFKELPSNFSASRIIDVHAFLLSDAKILESYVQILRCLAEIIQTLLTTKNLYQLQQNLVYFKEKQILKNSGARIKFWKTLIGLNSLSNDLANEIFNPKFVIKYFTKKSNLSEILYILTNFLGGKRKSDVQKKLAELGFHTEVFPELFTLLFHPEVEIDSPQEVDPLHGEDCHCNDPVASARIQLLKVFTNFCDDELEKLRIDEDIITKAEQTQLRTLIKEIIKTHHHDYESLAFSEPKELIPQLDLIHPYPLQNNKLSVFDPAYFAQDYFSKAKPYGILHKIILLLQKIKPDSSFRYVLASCVESFLRGCTSNLPLYQIFVAHTGLLYTLTSQIVQKKMVKPNNIQITYDMLGQIVKWNKSNLLLLENICTEYSWHKQLMTLMSENVIDSNVFLRSLILSFEHFDFLKLKMKNSKTSLIIDEFSKKSTFTQILQAEEIKFLELLANAVKSDTMNQDSNSLITIAELNNEDICCINTMLIMLIFAKGKNKFKAYFQHLCGERFNNVLFFEEFRELLEVWQRYYLSKRKDSYGLESTTRIPFYFFLRIKDAILEEINQLEQNTKNVATTNCVPE